MDDLKAAHPPEAEPKTSAISYAWPLTKKILRIVVGVVLLLLGLAALFTPFTPGSWLAVIGLEFLGLRVLLRELAVRPGPGQTPEQTQKGGMPDLQSGPSGCGEAEMVATLVSQDIRRSDMTSRTTDERKADEGLAAPLGLTHHERGHQLRGAPMVSDVDTAATARIPTEEEEFRFQQEAIFFLSAEHGSSLGP